MTDYYIDLSEIRFFVPQETENVDSDYLISPSPVTNPMTVSQNLGNRIRFVYFVIYAHCSDGVQTE